MPKCPLLDFLILFEIFESKAEFWAIRRVSATSVSLSNPKTGLDQSEAVKIEFLTLGYTEQKIQRVQGTRKKKISAQIFMASNSHLPMHFSAGVRTALFSPLLSSTEQRKRRGTDYSRPLAFGLQDTGTDFSRFQQKNLYLIGSPNCQKFKKTCTLQAARNVKTCTL